VEPSTSTPTRAIAVRAERELRSVSNMVTFLRGDEAMTSSVAQLFRARPPLCAPALTRRRRRDPRHNIRRFRQGCSPRHHIVPKQAPQTANRRTFQALTMRPQSGTSGHCQSALARLRRSA
jgi:hypothetical protein